MKKVYKKTKSRFFTILPFACSAVLLLFANLLSAQTYYSYFSNPSAHGYVINAGDSGQCTAPAVQNPTAFADSMPETYSYFTISLLAPFTCANSYYHFVSNLNVPGDTTLLDSGYKAGVRIRVPSGITLENLRKYTVLSTFTNAGTFVEAGYPDSIMGIDSMGNGTDWYLYFNTTKPFNTIELNVDPNIAPLGTQNFEFDVYYVVASREFVFPATLQNFKVTGTGSDALVSFQSLTETNVANFAIQRSSNDGRSYSTVATLAAKGNSTSTVSYAFTDKEIPNGNYLYRIQIVNRDGSSKTTSLLPLSVSSGGKMLVYPSVISAGQAVNVRTSLTGTVQVLLYDAGGRMVSQQKVTSAGQFTVSTTGLGKGIYTVRLIAANGTAQQGRFVVN